MGFIDRADFDVLRSLAAGSIGASYTAIGSPLQYRFVAINFKNDTNGDVIVSNDGVNGKLFFPANSYDAWDVRTNAPNFTNLVFPIGTQFYLMQGPNVPSTGNFYIEILIIRTD